MANEIASSDSLSILDTILNKEQVSQILKQSLKDDWNLSCAEVRPASEELTGFLGEHLKITLYVTTNGSKEKVHLFVKRVPINNKPKAEFIDNNGFFKREQLMFQLIDEMCAADCPNPWCVKVLLNTESLLVMHDVSIQGYSTHPPLESFDLAHTLAAVTSIARYHADMTNYQARRRINENRSWTFLQQYGHIIYEPNFKDSPWLRCAAKLDSNLIKIFSKKYNNLPELETMFVKLFIEGCDSLKEYNETLNILIHRDLWSNNIMFRYEKGLPCHALLIDFQCGRYGPPAFDLTVFLYYNTSRIFRERHEKEIFHHYYTVFSEHLDDYSKRELKCLGYDEENFIGWCERSRMLALVITMGIMPYILMDPKIAQQVFNNPETYDKYTLGDRTEPVVAHCYESKNYMLKQLENCEEFVERFVLKQ